MMGCGMSAILVVEDNKLNQEVALGLLIDEGFKVDIANDGREAIDMIQQNYYDIVLMDMQMPVMNGVEATIEIRKNAKFDSLPIVAMTANAMLQDREKCLQAGMNDFISKPIDPEELFRTLLQWIRPKHLELSSTSDTQQSQLNAHTIESLPVIDGLNVSLGLKRVLGKTTLYFNLLRHYVSNQENMPQEIQVALDTGDIESAERLAHTAKNVNGNIGASELENLAGEIEHLLRENTSLEMIGPKIDHFKNKQQSLIADLRAAISTIKKSEPIKDGEQSTEVIIKQLKDFLLDDDSAALTYFEENSTRISRSFSIKVFSNIEIAIKQFDFEKALQLLTNS
jgi:two-component system sensor histidine kinase/response regulator